MNGRNKKVTHLNSLIAVCVLMLGGCGGGGAGEAPAAPTMSASPPAPTLITASLDGIAADGYLAFATVC